MFSNENYLDELQNTELKRTLINFNSEFKDTKRHLCILEENKCLRAAQEKPNLRPNEMRKTIQDLETTVNTDE